MKDPQQTGEKELLIYLRPDENIDEVLGKIPLRFARFASTIQKEYGQPGEAWLLKLTANKLE